MSGGGKGGERSEEAQKELLERSGKLFDLALPSLELAGESLQELLGDSRDPIADLVGALQTVTGRRVEAAKEGASTALRTTEDILTRRGITGSDAGRILGDIAFRGATNVANVPAETLASTVIPTALKEFDRTQNTRQLALNAVLGVPSISLQGTGTAGQLANTQQANELGFLSNLISSTSRVGAAFAG